MSDTLDVQPLASPPTSTPWVPLWPLSQNPPTPVEGKWLKGSSGAMVWSDITQADVSGLTAALAAKQATAEKAQVNGYASLGSDGKVPTAQLPTIPPAYTLPARLGSSPYYPPPGSDWNQAWENGWYMGTGLANCPPGLTGWNLGIVINHNSAWVTQEVWDFTNQAAGRWRRWMNGGAWTAWRPLHWIEAMGGNQVGLAVTAWQDHGGTAVTVPTSGNYWVQWGASLYQTDQAYFGLSINGGAPSVPEYSAGIFTWDNNPFWVNVEKTKKINLSAGTALAGWVYSNHGGLMQDRYVRITSADV
jgi:hypothetical protein